MVLPTWNQGMCPPYPASDHRGGTTIFKPDAIQYPRKGDVLTVWKTSGCLAGQGGPVGNVGGALGNRAEISYLEFNRIVRLVNGFKL